MHFRLNSEVSEKYNEQRNLIEMFKLKFKKYVYHGIAHFMHD